MLPRIKQSLYLELPSVLWDPQGQGFLLHLVGLKTKGHITVRKKKNTLECHLSRKVTGYSPGGPGKPGSPARMRQTNKIKHPVTTKV